MICELIGGVANPLRSRNIEQLEYEIHETFLRNWVWGSRIVGLSVKIPYDLKSVSNSLPRFGERMSIEQERGCY